jgi:predicted esterase
MKTKPMGLVRFFPPPRRSAFWEIVGACCAVAWVLFFAACGGGDEARGFSSASVGAGAGSPAGGSNNTGSNSSSSSSSSGSGGAAATCEVPPVDMPFQVDACPNIKEGLVRFAFDQQRERDVEVRVSKAAETKRGPLVVLWHGDEQTAQSAIEDLLDSKTRSVILDAGGVIVSPKSDPNAGAGTFPWWYTLGGEESSDDVDLLDQIVACARSQFDVDPCRIHTLGFSEGAMQAAQVAARRSNYIASAVMHSPALLGEPAVAEPNNLYALLVFYGGLGDGDGFDFGTASPGYAADQATAGHFVALCDHAGGHVIAPDSTALSWEFLQAHPFGLYPSPYATQLPASFPAYCEAL